MIFELEYASARVRALRSKLLKPKIKEEVLTSTTKDELIAHLENSAYEAMFASKDIDEIEDNFNTHLLETLNKVTSFLPKKYRDDFNRYLERFDLNNLKLILRAQNQNPDQVKKDMIQYGTIYELKDVLIKKDITTLENSLEATIWFQAYKQGNTNYKSTHKLRDLEHELDRRYITELKKIDIEPVKKFTELYMQIIDTQTIARLGHEKAKPYLFAKEHKEKEMTQLENNAKTALLTDPFGIGLYIEFMFRKEMETKLIKSILRRVWK